MYQRKQIPFFKESLTNYCHLLIKSRVEKPREAPKPTHNTGSPLCTPGYYQAPGQPTTTPTTSMDQLHTSLPSSSNTSNCREIRYWAGATICQTQFLLVGYSLGHPGLVMVPLSVVMKPPQAAGEAINEHKVYLVLSRRRKDCAISFVRKQVSPNLGQYQGKGACFKS